MTLGDPQHALVHAMGREANVPAHGHYPQNSCSRSKQQVSAVPTLACSHLRKMVLVPGARVGAFG